MSTSLYAHTSGVPAKTYTWKAVCPLQLYETIVVSIYTHLFNAIRIYVYSAEIIQKEVTKSKTHVLLQRRWPQTPKGATKKNKELFIFTSPNASSDFLLLFVKNIGCCLPTGRTYQQQEGAPETNSVHDILFGNDRLHLHDQDKSAKRSSVTTDTCLPRLGYISFRVDRIFVQSVQYIDTDL